MLVDIAQHRVNESAVVRLRLAVGRRPIQSGACLVNLDQLAYSTEKLALEISPWSVKIWKGHPKREKNALTAAMAVTSAVWVTFSGACSQGTTGLDRPSS